MNQFPLLPLIAAVVVGPTAGEDADADGVAQKTQGAAPPRALLPSR